MDEQTLKKCSKCGEEKPLSEFFKDKHSSTGFTCQCKQCQKERSNKNKDKITEYHKEWYLKNKDILSKKAKIYYLENKEQFKQYAEENKEKISQRMKQWNLDNIETVKEKRKEYYKENKKYILERDKKYREEHKEERAEYNKKYQKLNKDKIRNKTRKTTRERFKTDINFKITELLRTRVRAALKKNWKSGPTLVLLGCNIEFLKHHLESKFKEGMNWNNYGKGGWVIDHILPCCSFNMSKPEEQKICFHYTNLQPLWEEENQAKISFDRQLKKLKNREINGQ
jgi:hypothetical protein